MVSVMHVSSNAYNIIVTGFWCPLTIFGLMKKTELYTYISQRETELFSAR